MKRKLLCLLLAAALMLTFGCTPAAPQATATPASTTAAPAKTAAPAATTQATAAVSPTAAPQAQLDLPENFNLEGYPIVNKPITMTWLQSKNANACTKECKDMKVYQYMEELTGIHIEWIDVLSNARAEKVNLIFASGDMPDVMIAGIGGTVELLNFAEEDLLMPLNDLIENYAPRITAAFEEMPELRAASTTSTGEIYGIAAYAANEISAVPNKIFINGVWLTNLGMKMPKTTDELYQVLVAFRDNDPNQNGQSDEIPFCWRSTEGYGLFHPWGVPHEIMVSDGKVYMTYTSDAYKEGLKYYRKLYAEGLLDQESFTQDMTQILAKNSGEKATVGMFLASRTSMGASGDYHLDYQGMPPLMAKAGDTPVWGAKQDENIMVGRFVVSSENPYPEATIRWADACFDNYISAQMFTGIENETWKYLDDGSVAFTSIPYEGMNWPQSRHLETPASGTLYYLPNFTAKDGTENAEVNVGASLMYMQYPLKESYPGIVYYTAKDAETISEIRASVDTYVSTCRAQFITGVLDIDKEWENYKTTLTNMRLDELVSIYQAYYDAFLANS